MNIRREWTVIHYEKKTGKSAGLSGVITLLVVEAQSRDADYAGPKDDADEPFGVCRARVPLGDPVKRDFIKEASVTSAIMLGWARAALGENVTFYENSADDDLMNKVKPGVEIVLVQ